LDEAKKILHGLQEHFVRQQLGGYLDAHRPCPDCHRLRAIKGYHPLRFRSAFGDNKMFEMDGAIEEDREARRPVHLVLKKLARALEEFGTYIDNNASGIVNYGERHRCGERISTGFVESTINQLIAKRFVKKQQMRWTPRGAHLLLQVRVQTLNGDLHATFERWYPALRNQQGKKLAA
jgi:hypothetical protein